MVDCSIFIPAYNAAEFLESVIDRIPLEIISRVKTIHIINDGSTDNTAAVGYKLSVKHSQILVHDFSENQGYGAVVKFGLTKCLEDQSDYSICLHGDGQYPPEFIPILLNELQNQKGDLIQGSRHALKTARAGGMPYYKILLGKIMVWLENRTFKLQQTDYHSGFLVYRNKFLQQVPLEKLSASFDIDLELIATACANHFSVLETPIPTHYGQEKSYLNPLSYGIRVLKVLGRYRRGFYEF